MQRTYTVILRKEPEGSYTVIVPALPGCLTCGDTVPEALLMAREAIECYLESLLQHDAPIPDEGPVLSFEPENMTDNAVHSIACSVEA